MLEKFSMPSLLLLTKIQQGVDSLKAFQIKRDEGKILNYLIMMVNKMYLQKSTECQAGEYVGSDKEDNLFKGIMTFIMIELKQSVLFVVQVILEVTSEG